MLWWGVTVLRVDTSAPILGRRGAIVVADLPAMLLGRVITTLGRWRGLVRSALVRWVCPYRRLGGVGPVRLLGSLGAVVLRGHSLLLLLCVRVVVGRASGRFGVLRGVSAVSTSLWGAAGRESAVGLWLWLVPTGIGGVVGLLLPWGAVVVAA